VNELARIRALWLELGQAIDAAELAVAPRLRPVKRASPRRRALPPEQMPSQEAIDSMARTLRRKGFET
jgi:hypothetical protein